MLFYLSFHERRYKTMKIIAAILAVLHLLLTCHEINNMLQCYYAACNRLRRQGLLRLIHLIEEIMKV